jgi:hypothetical protein
MKIILASGLLLLALAGCQADPFCRQHNAATFGPSRDAWRAMSPSERAEAKRTFNEAARRCGWEP